MLHKIDYRILIDDEGPIFSNKIKYKQKSSYVMRRLLSRKVVVFHVASTTISTSTML